MSAQHVVTPLAPPNFLTFAIESNNGLPSGSEVRINGEFVENVVSAEYRIGVDQVSELHLTVERVPALIEGLAVVYVHVLPEEGQS